MTQQTKSGIVKWKSPSNIALVKYWGKYGRQYPQNPSISLTLDKAHTVTSVEYAYSDSKMSDIKLEFSFEGKPNQLFRSKIRNYLRSIEDIYPWIYHLNLNIKSSNSFPHSSGIASSASAMSALALCLVDIASEIDPSFSGDRQVVSQLARLGSGSACRSVYGPVAVWGESDSVPGSSNDYAIPFAQPVDEIFNTYHDDILIISASEKEVSSRAGHSLMDNNIYAHARFEQAHYHLTEIISAMVDGDLEKFGEILEKEAFTLHALMMASDPPYFLMKPQTIAVIDMVRDFRASTGLPVYFTLDAGPNIHLLYPDRISAEILAFEKQLESYCENGLIIRDRVGTGPVKLI